MGYEAGASSLVRLICIYTDYDLPVGGNDPLGTASGLGDVVNRGGIAGHRLPAGRPDPDDSGPTAFTATCFHLSLNFCASNICDSAAHG